MNVRIAQVVLLRPQVVERGGQLVELGCQLVQVRTTRQTAVAADQRSALTRDVQPTDSYSDVCDEANIVCAATHSPTPVVHREFLSRGVHVTSVGYNTARREIDS